ncbi:hypothetical protein KAJ02_00350 [Candidatus Bipolaricaulota bacterium]|nr:hypothetical protein [Candidatus Bipolaricaulota bacterium]
MTVPTISMNSDAVLECGASWRRGGAFSTASLRFFTLTQQVTPTWYAFSTPPRSQDEVVLDGYREMGPTNLQLAKAFSAKVRKSWPEW